MARAVILGGGGFIGANLARRLLADGHEVTCADIAFPEFRRVPEARNLFTDLRDRYQTTAVMRGADWAFHLAADMGGVGYFHSDADFAASTDNGLITLNVARAAAQLGTQRVFYASSACCYPIELQQTAGRPVRLDEHKIGRGTPDALYGAEKLHGLRIMGKLPNARVGVLHTVYGPLQEHEGRRMKFPAAVATKAIAARHSGRLELWGDGGQMRSYLYVDDAVERIVRIMTTDNYDGPVNVGADGAVTCREVAEMCLALAGAEGAQIVTNPAEPSGVLARDCDNSAFVARYGTIDDVTLRDGFSRFIGWLDEVR